MAAECLLSHLQPPEKSGLISIFAGPGNNGGDGYVIARHLLNRGYSVWTFLCTEKHKIRGDALLNLTILEKMTDQIQDCQKQADWEPWRERVAQSSAIVDAILGTGLTRDVDGWLLTMIQNINEMQHPFKMAVDIPSGLDSDTGHSRPTCVKSDLTTTFAAAKVGLAMPAAVPWVGQLKVIDIGMPREIIESTPEEAMLQQESELRELWPVRTFNSHKGTFGHLLVLAGSPGKSGAALLSCMAALRSGVGLCTWTNSTHVLQAMQSRILEVMTASIPALDALASEEDPSSEDMERIVVQTLAHTEGKTAWVIGPGLGQSRARQRWLNEVLVGSELPVILDADGLNLLSDQVEILRERKGSTILTPHPGEMGRLTGKTSREVQSNRWAIATEWAQNYQVTVVLKGARTIIASPDGSCWLNPTGHNGLATAGSGDVLSGIIGAFLARGMKAPCAARLAVYLHGKAADELQHSLGQSGLIASDLIKQLPHTLAAWENAS